MLLLPYSRGLVGRSNVKAVRVILEAVKMLTDSMRKDIGREFGCRGRENARRGRESDT